MDSGNVADTTSPAEALVNKTAREGVAVSHLARSTVLLMITFGIAKVISLGQVVIIANVFGLSKEWDAFVTANSIPELLVVLIGGGALGYAFIPVFGGLLAQEKRSIAWELASHVMNTIFSVTALLSVIAFVIAPWLIQSVVAPGFDPEQVFQTAILMRILLLSTLVFSLSGIFQAILHSHNHFLLPALSPILLDVGILFGVVFLVPLWGVYGIAWGAVLGSLLHMGIQVPGLFKYKMRWSAALGWGDPRLRQVIRLMIPRLLGLAVVSFNLFLVPNNIASRLEVGAIGAFNWGWRLMQIPETLLGSAMGFVIFPTLAALSELGDAQGKRRSMVGALRFVLMATIPSAVGLIMLGRPLIGLLERGAFDAAASDMVYSTLLGFSLGLIGHSTLEIVARSFYADKDTLTPLYAALTAAAVNLALSLLLADLVGVGGLALANSVAVVIEVSVLVIILRRRWQGIEGRMVLSVGIRALLASAVMALAILALDAVLNLIGFRDGGLVKEVIWLAVLMAGGLAAYVTAGLLLGLREIRQVIGLLLARERRAAAQPVGD